MHKGLRSFLFPLVIGASLFCLAPIHNPPARITKSYTVTAGGGDASVVLTIDPGYSNLRISVFGNGADNTSRFDLLMRFNADTGSNYAPRYQRHYVFGTLPATAALTDASASGTNIVVAPDSFTNSTFPPTTCIIDILGYGGATTKMAVSRYAFWDGTISSHGLCFGGWNNTAAITSVTFTVDTGNIKQGTKFVWTVE